MHLGDHAFRDQDVLDALKTPEPQAKYLELMDKCPVRHNADGTVTLLRMADIQMVNKAPDTLGNGHSGGGIGAFTRPLIPLDLDGPDHRRWRKILAGKILARFAFESDCMRRAIAEPFI